MRILLAIDGSPSSNVAVDEVCRRPWPPGSEVRLLTVLSPIEFNHLHEASHQPVTYDDIFEKTGWKSLRFLNNAASELELRAPDLTIKPVLLEGRPKEVILEEAERWGPDLIVVGSHGYGKLERAFLGSVSLAIAVKAPCSVEIVRRPTEYVPVGIED